MRKIYTPSSAAADTLAAIKLFDGSWQLQILFHLFDGKVQRYSDLEKLIPAISQKMLAQQLKCFCYPLSGGANRYLTTITSNGPAFDCTTQYQNAADLI